MSNLKEKLGDLIRCFEEQYGLKMGLRAYALDKDNPGIDAVQAASLRERLFNDLELVEKYQTNHPKDGYFTLGAYQNLQLRTDISIYCRGEWPEELLGPAPKSFDAEKGKEGG